eukprot:comp22519_c0_seq1/m.56545 comp22519_c0_seq1/g.56545  ORF comp22519_c0_seq1/g.56545 comp22519_c0_seq1/m.56545 type:complete len:300 (-) comp22519_c0_seq1:4085-4984(-)
MSPAPSTASGWLPGTHCTSTILGPTAVPQDPDDTTDELTARVWFHGSRNSRDTAVATRSEPAAARRNSDEETVEDVLLSWASANRALNVAGTVRPPDGCERVENDDTDDDTDDDDDGKVLELGSENAETADAVSTTISNTDDDTQRPENCTSAGMGTTASEPAAGARPSTNIVSTASRLGNTARSAAPVGPDSTIWTTSPAERIASLLSGSLHCAATRTGPAASPNEPESTGLWAEVGTISTCSASRSIAVGATVTRSSCRNVVAASIENMDGLSVAFWTPPMVSSSSVAEIHTPVKFA